VIHPSQKMSANFVQPFGQLCLTYLYTILYNILNIRITWRKDKNGGALEIINAVKQKNILIIDTGNFTNINYSAA